MGVMWMGFLYGYIHTLVLMDDTVLLSTRHGKQRTLPLLNEYCKGHGMCANNVKTKCFALNCLPEERVPFIIEQIAVE